MTEWLPLSLRGTQDPEELKRHLGPFPGVPEWLAVPLANWAQGELIDLDPHYGVVETDVQKVLSLEMQLRRRLPLNGNPTVLRQNLYEMALADQRGFLDIVDCLCRTAHTAAIHELERDLALGASEWKADPNSRQLVRRIDPVAHEQALRAMGTSDRTSEHLRSAWVRVYGRSPDPTGGYGEAIKAVEALTSALFEPNNRKSTLGTVIGHLRSNLNKWDVTLHDPKNEGQPRFVGMLQLLWEGQSTRHGGGDPDIPREASIEEAQAALHLAITIAQWLRDGVVIPVGA